jgi:hypothetical protein
MAVLSQSDGSGEPTNPASDDQNGQTLGVACGLAENGRVPVVHCLCRSSQTVMVLTDDTDSLVKGT